MAFSKGESGLSASRAVVPAFALAAAGSVLFSRAPAARADALAMHHLGLSMLFSFLTMGEICHALLWWSCRGRAIRSAVTIAGIWRILTEYLPVAAAILILVSGLRLVYVTQLSLQQGWLFYLICGLAALAADGATGYTESVQSLWRAAQEARESGTDVALRAVLGRWGFHALFLSHYLAFFALLALGYRKPGVFHPFARLVARIENAWPSGTGSLTEMLIASSLIVLVSIVVLLGRGLGRSLRREET
jgi:hypothetical protein